MLMGRGIRKMSRRLLRSEGNRYCLRYDNFGCFFFFSTLGVLGSI